MKFKRIIIYLIFLLLFTLIGFTKVLFADEDEDSFFKEDVTKKVEEIKKESKLNEIQLLFGANFYFTNSFRYFIDKNYYINTGTISGNGFIKIYNPLYGSFYISYYTDTTLFVFSDSESYTLSSALTHQPVFINKELFFDFNFGKIIFIRAGKQILSFGSSFFWTPVDFINLTMKNAFADFDSREGVPGIKLLIPFGTMNFFLFLNFYDSTTNPPDILESQVYLRFEFTISGFEFAFSTAFQKNKKTLFGFDFSGRIFQTDVYGEFAFSKGSDTPILKLNETGFVPYSLTYTNDYVFKVSVGFQKSFGEEDEFNISGEFFYNSIGYDDNSTYNYLIGLGLFQTFYVGKYYAYLSISWINIIKDILSISISGVGNFSDFSYMIITKFNFSFSNTLPFSIIFNYYGGENFSEFTLNERIISISFQTSINY